MAADNEAKQTLILPAQNSTLNHSCVIVIWSAYLRRKKFKNYHRFLQYNLKFVCKHNSFQHCHEAFLQLEQILVSSPMTLHF